MEEEERKRAKRAAAASSDVVDARRRIACIVGASLRNFLNAVFRLFSAAGGSGGSATTMLVLFTAEVQALYFLSSVLLIRNNLPAKYRGFITAAMGGDGEGNRDEDLSLIHI